MKEKEQVSERKRRDWIIILIILLIGFLCVIIAGEQAVRFSPRWKLDTNMRSNLDPDSDFLTNQPVNFYEPLDPAILTQPVWINVFLTPGAVIPPINVIPPTGTTVSSPTPITQASPTTFAVATITNTGVPTVSPTNTLIYIPPPPSTNTPKPPSTSTPKPPSTSTPITPLPTADLAINKNDGGVTTVNPGNTVTYTVRVTNNGPSSVTGAVLSDPAASGLSKTAVACSITPGQCITPPTSADLESGTFALPALSNGQFYEITISATVNATTGSVTNTATVAAPAGFTDPTGNNSASDTNTVNLVADLQITKDDGATAYEADGSITYTIDIYNAGPSDVTDARVQDTFTMTTDSISWTCTASGTGAACGNGSGSGNIDELVDLPALTSVTYQVTVDIAASETGNITNEANVTPPSGITDPVPGNNTASDPDPDVLVTSSGTSYGGIGTGSDGGIEPLPAGGPPVVLTLSSPITIGSHAGPDLVYFEQDIGGIAMDWIILEVSDGSNWYPVLNWGDGAGNPGTNIDLPLPVPPNTTTCAGEPDNCPIVASLLYPFPGYGITIDLDNAGLAIPNGAVISYLRITVPSGGDDGGAGIDGIYVVP